MMHDNKSAEAAPRYVFVYGTLRRGESNDINRLVPPPHWIGIGNAAATLYHLGAYPGAVLGGEALVRGEVYAIDAQVEMQLDAIECIEQKPQDEYFKREIEVVVAAKSLRCLVYEISPEWLKGRSRIEGGDWVQFRNSQPASLFSP